MSSPAAAPDGLALSDASAGASPDGVEDELKPLGDLCDRLAGFGSEVDVEWIDGFFAALVVGPRVVTPQEWLPLAFDDAFDRAFADPEDRAHALGVLLQHHDRVAAMLRPETLLADESVLHYAPVMLEWDEALRSEVVADGELDAEEAAVLLQTGDEWAHGFLYAVRSFDADWAGHGMNREEQRLLGSCLAAIGMLFVSPDPGAREDHTRRVYGGRPPTRDELIDAACYAVQDLRLLWFEHLARPQPRQVAKTPGRNDPCPCGSGKKYKKCCGAAG